MTSFSSNLKGCVSKGLKSLDGRTARGFSGFLVPCRTPEWSHWVLLVQSTFAFFPPSVASASEVFPFHLPFMPVFL